MKKDNPLFDPSCCNYKLSGKIRNHVEKILATDQVDTQTKAVLSELLAEEEANKNTLGYESLTRLHKYLQRSDSEYIEPFYLFLEECRCIPPKPRDNKQLEARLQTLRLRNSQKIYHSMTASVDRAVDRLLDSQSNEGGELARNTISPTSPNEYKVLNGAFMAVVNSFLVYICTFVFCYKALEYSLAEPHIIAQVLFGLLGSTIVACAELYFLARVI